MEAKLQEACVQTRLESLHRIPTPTQRADVDDEHTGVGMGSASSSARKPVFDNSDEDEKEIVMMLAEHREERDKNAVKRDEERLVTDRQRTAEGVQNNNGVFALQAQHIAVDHVGKMFFWTPSAVRWRKKWCFPLLRPDPDVRLHFETFGSLASKLKCTSGSKTFGAWRPNESDIRYHFKRSLSSISNGAWSPFLMALGDVIPVGRGWYGTCVWL